MKKYLFSLAMLLVSTSTFAQSKNFEPDFNGQVVVINADSTTTLLQKEQTSTKMNSTKFGYIPIPGSGLLDKSSVNLVVKGAKSQTTLPAGRLTFVIKAKDNDEDPRSVFAIFQFDVKKKRRQYKMAEAGILNGVQSTMSFNTVDFEAKKYGDNCYLVVIENAEPGQYGVSTADISQVSTFGVE